MLITSNIVHEPVVRIKHLGLFSLEGEMGEGNKIMHGARKARLLETLFSPIMPELGVSL